MTTLYVVPGGAPGPKGGGMPSSYRALGGAKRSPYFATVVGESNSGLVIVEVIVPLDRSGLSVTRMSVFATPSTNQRLLPWRSIPSSEPALRPATSTGALAPVTGPTVTNLSRTALSPIIVAHSPLAPIPSC